MPNKKSDKNLKEYKVNIKETEQELGWSAQNEKDGLTVLWHGKKQMKKERHL